MSQVHLVRSKSVNKARLFFVGLEHYWVDFIELFVFFYFMHFYPLRKQVFSRKVKSLRIEQVVEGVDQLRPELSVSSPYGIFNWLQVETKYAQVRNKSLMFNWIGEL